MATTPTHCEVCFETREANEELMKKVVNGLAAESAVMVRWSVSPLLPVVYGTARVYTPGTARSVVGDQVVLVR